MTTEGAPLTTRDAIVRALAEHDWHAADDFDWSRPCRHADHQFSAFCAVCSGDLGLMADALLASGALTDAAAPPPRTLLAMRDGLADALAEVTSHWSTPQGEVSVDYFERDEFGAELVDAALAAALSAQSERAEVER